MPETKQKPDITLTLTQSEYESALSRVRAVDGVKVTDNNVIQYKSIRIGFGYESGKLSLTVLHHPIIVTRGYVVGTIREWLDMEQAKGKKQS